ncbi:alpha/beta hydrolase family protein [Sphingomonas sp. M1-B02]|uniref:alpha/beta hydrolase family protein n=1 Tax=Sphingomonas sp. M1-B02 TaxID=3114300 RepID=UPI00223EDDCD|nr:S9 family peptidase [Sphingomonas sp. S6-11]UZK64836.1 S9 family peptidase [Sphingomonas sp. S6-11]
MKIWSTTLGASLLVAVPAHGQSADAQKFGSREAVLQASLSPDGSKIAMISPVGAGAAVLVAPVDGSAAPKPILSSSGKPDQLRYCRWSTPARLICSVYFIEFTGATMVAYTRLVAVNADGSGLKQLTARANSEALGAAQFGGDILDWLPEDSGSAVLMERTFVPEATTGRLVARTSGGLGVERVDTVSLKRSTVEQPKGNAFGYWTDGHGAVRILGIRPNTTTGYDGNRLLYSYRLPGSRDWQDLSEVTITPQGTKGFVPLAVDRALNAVYGYDNQNGRSALYRIALDGSMKRELVFEHGVVDVDSLIRIGRQQRVVGLSYATEKRRGVFFDPELKALATSLSKALPGQPIVTFIDASADESKLLLFAGGDSDAGNYYLLDRKTKKMAEVSPVRPQLGGVRLAKVTPITFPAADGTMIPGYLTLPAGSDGKNLPGIVMPHGGPGARDEWGFDWLSQYYAARGFAVLQPNFRGSAGYGDAWFRKNGFQSWQTAVGDVNDGGRWLLKQGIAAPGKLGIVGWSYGGYAALQSQVLDADLFKAIVAIAPVTDLETLRKESENFTNYKQVDAFIGRGAHVREGSPAQNVDRIKAPVLLFHGDKDLNVGVGESRLMASRLRSAGKKVDYVEFDGLDHQLEDDKARIQMLDQSDRFLRTAMGLPAKP